MDAASSLEEEQRPLIGNDAAALPPSQRGRYAAAALLLVAAAASALVALTRTSASTAGFSAFAPRLQLAKAGKLTYSALSLKEQKALFEEFKATHGKRYGQTVATASANDEESDRFAAFVDNLARADERNARERQRGGTAVHGVTQFSDMTPGEFKRNYLGYVAPAKNAIKDADVAKVRKYTGSATSVNWTGVYTTAVNNQGYCGSCWAFSAVEQLESDAIRQGLLTKNEKLQLSVQQVVSCDTTDNVPKMFANAGCSGGSTEAAYLYMAYVGGVVPDSDYPYTSFYGNTGDCLTTVTDYQMTVSGYKIVNGEADMQSYLLSTGPLSICVDASDWSTYESGVVSVCGNDVNHCVQLVGVDTADGYYIIRNSWGTSWGEDGYIRLQTNQDMCGISSIPTYSLPVRPSRRA